MGDELVLAAVAAGTVLYFYSQEDTEDPLEPANESIEKPVVPPPAATTKEDDERRARDNARVEDQGDVYIPGLNGVPSLSVREVAPTVHGPSTGIYVPEMNHVPSINVLPTIPFQPKENERYIPEMNHVPSITVKQVATPTSSSNMAFEDPVERATQLFANRGNGVNVDDPATRKVRVDDPTTRNAEGCTVQ